MHSSQTFLSLSIKNVGIPDTVYENHNAISNRFWPHVVESFTLFFFAKNKLTLFLCNSRACKTGAVFISFLRRSWKQSFVIQAGYRLSFLKKFVDLAIEGAAFFAFLIEKMMMTSFRAFIWSKRCFEPFIYLFWVKATLCQHRWDRLISVIKPTYW